MVDLIKLVTKTRGRGTREVPYDGIGVEVKDEQGEVSIKTDGVLTTLEDALTLPNIDNSLQKVLDIFVRGYNAFMREAAVDIDEFAEFIGQLPAEMQADEKKVDAFKRSVRALAKVAETELADAAETILAKINKAKAA